jgi:TonB family protein
MSKIFTRFTALPLAAILLIVLPFCRGNNSNPRSMPGSAVNEASKPAPPLPFSVSKVDTVWYRVDELPVFSYDEGAMADFLRNNIRYPEPAIKKGIQGRVVVGFVLTKDCMVRDAKIITGLGPECDNEALRVVNMLPKFAKPATVKGKPVNYHFTQPVHFTMQ